MLRQKYGTVYVTFAEPISLDAALGERRERFQQAIADPAIEEEKRHFIQKLGFRLLREVNDVAVAGATSVSSTVLLSAPRRRSATASSWRRPARSPSFDPQGRDADRVAATEHRELLREPEFLQNGKLLEWMKDRDGDIIHAPPEKRMILDFYKNNVIHFFLIPSLVAHALRRGVPRVELREAVWWWLDLFRWEFALPEREAVAGRSRTRWRISAQRGALEGART